MKTTLLFEVNSCDGPLVLQLVVVLRVIVVVPDVVIVIVLVLLVSLPVNIYLSLVTKISSLYFTNQWFPQPNICSQYVQTKKLSLL